MLNRRQLVKGAMAAVPALAAGCAHSGELWTRSAYRKPAASRVAILDAPSYDAPLADIVYRGLELFDLPIRGKKVVLKPNLVEYDPDGSINTHPAVIAATIEAFRRMDAGEVVVAEGAGHRRDNEYLLTASSLAAVLKEYGTPYVDLNYDDVRPVPLESRYSDLSELYLPQTVLGADLLVSMPKLKTHHWAGVTLSMKNLFGIIPGAIYGWPKNVLHWAGLQESIIDINSTLPVPRFAIVDGVIGMEGNGPIQGDARHCGVLILGEDFVATDATAARLMTIDPSRISYLTEADRFLGNLSQQNISLLGEGLDRFRQDFRLLDRFQNLKPDRV